MSKHNFSVWDWDIHFDFVRLSAHSAQREFSKLNDEHQGEGGTLVFVEANLTTNCFFWQDPNF